ncbi:hypothetical protein DUNSADRAFT_2279 [Dunaliella salina]|uniref:Uncharacterized protein n=1 Tax=Dunaliella salina TaxID=3046 RepID=A0ABQ7GVZ5_DUNSA|nr:hypothetical protein DUNSADRAFT_2279 [Dunaliella salina]|eukprot:KAF5838735.1 hypothetical protein DUNSADRAFT_2279 [Dunaliella salina]
MPLNLIDYESSAELCRDTGAGCHEEMRGSYSRVLVIHADGRIDTLDPSSGFKLTNSYSFAEVPRCPSKNLCLLCYVFFHAHLENVRSVHHSARWLSPRLHTGENEKQFAVVKNS